MTGFDETLDPKVRFGTKYSDLMYDDVSGPDRGWLSSLIYIVLELSIYRPESLKQTEPICKL